jgi:hypothetical protein
MLLVLVLVGGACSGGDDAGGEDALSAAESAGQTTMAGEDVADGEAASPSGAADAFEGGEDEAANGPGTDAAAVVPTVDPASFGRKIIFTATLEVEVDDIVVAGEQAQAAVAGLGGFLFGQETQTGPTPRSVLTIKVEPGDFDEALRRLGGLGELLSQTIYADDVTERVVDLESQIETAEASVARLREFLDDATSLEDLAVLEAELLRRETDLELLRGRLRTLEDQVALATIVLVLTEPAPPVPEPALELSQTAYAGHTTGAGCPGSERITIDEGDEMTVCYVVTNTGDTTLTDVEVRDPGLDAESKDMIVVLGDPTVPLQPQERIVFAFETAAEWGMWVGPDVTAVAVDEDGEPLRQPITVEIEEAELDVIEDTSLPGFADSVGSAFDSLQRMLGFVVVGAGALVPFLWVPLLVAGWIWWRRRRSRPDTGGSEPEPPAPPQPSGTDQAIG